MSKKAYSEKLKSPKWQKKRLEILNRDNFTCIKCGDKETELHINHLKYTGEPHDAPNEDLETLCKHCHLLYHKFNGKIVGDIKKHYVIDGDIPVLVFNTDVNTRIVIIHNNNTDEIVEFVFNSDILKSCYELNQFGSFERLSNLF